MNREYRHIDKSEWGPGAWADEPDKVQWYDEATGFPCLIVRTPHHGALCGYVGVRPGHPWHGKHYNAVGAYQPKPEAYDENWYPDVHGGLTFAGPCREGAEEDGICHIPEPGDTDDVWWLGFDCAQVGDLCPAMEALTSKLDVRNSMLQLGHLVEGIVKGFPEGNDTYKDIDYVRGQVENLAKQALKVMEA